MKAITQDAQPKLLAVVKTPRHTFSSLEQKIGIVRGLVEQGAELGDCRPTGVLAHVLRHDLEDWLRAFLACGLDVTAAGRGWWLDFAISHQADRSALSLIDAGIDVCTPSEAPTRHTPLHTAVQHSRVAVIERLLAAGVDLEARNTAGETALHLCMDVPIMRLLLDAGAEVDANIVEGEGQPAFTTLARLTRFPFKDGNLIACIALLLERGADVRASAGTATVAEYAMTDKRVAPLMRAHLAREQAQQALQEIELAARL